MSTTIRTDSHRPSAIVPDNYEYVACEHIKTEGDPGLCEYQNEQRETIRVHMASTGGTYSRHEHGGNCHVCGSVNLIYSILFYHEPSNSYIRVGEDCAEKLEMGGTREMSAFRAAMRNALEAQTGKRKAQAVLAERNLSALWEIYYQTNLPGARYEEQTISDIVGKLVKYGSVSDKALAFAESLLGKIANREQIAAQRAAEAEAAAPCPTGRVSVTGAVLSTKVQDSPWGTVIKMLVRDDSGFKVWCTLPSSVGAGQDGVDKGSRVTFTVTIEPSRDDPKFGFGKRPTKFTVIKEEAAQAVS